MEKPVKLPEEFISGIKELSIDASSIIYLLKVGILGSVAAEISLISPQQIIEEVGWPHLPVNPVPIDNSEMTNDETVVELARLRKISVLSEDREVLDNARISGLKYYNTLMILNYLLLKKRIPQEEYPVYLARLIEISHYGRDILEYGESIKKLVEIELN